MNTRNFIICGTRAHEIAERLGEALPGVIVQQHPTLSNAAAPAARSELLLPITAPPSGDSIEVQIFTPLELELRPFWFPWASAFVLAFDPFESASLVALATRWLPLLEENAPTTPVFLAGWNVPSRLRSTHSLPSILREIPVFYVQASLAGANAAFSLLSACLVTSQVRAEHPQHYTKARPSTNWHIYTRHSSPLVSILARQLECVGDAGNRELDLSALDDPKLHPNVVRNLNFLLHTWPLQGLIEINALVSLDLSRNQLLSLPLVICQLPNLAIIDLSHNLLEYLPPQLTNLARLKRIKIQDNPLSHIPPSHRRNSSTILQYLRYLQRPSAPWEQLKLVVAGDPSSTYAELLKELQKRSYTKPTISHLFSPIHIRRRQPSNPRPTSMPDLQAGLVRARSGLQLSSWQASETLTYSCWELKSEANFLQLSSLFLSGRTVYLLVLRPELPSWAILEFWLHQIDTSSPYLSYVVLVGIVNRGAVHVTGPEVLRRFQNRFPFVREYFEVDLAAPASLDALHYYLTFELPAQHRLLSRPVQGSLKQLSLAVERLREDKIRTLAWTDFLLLSQQQGVSEEQAEIVAEILHDSGFLLNFRDRAGLSCLVIDPLWLSQVLSCVITDSGKYIKNGTLLQVDWKNIWRAYPSDIYPFLFSLLESFEVAHRLKTHLPQCLIPSLLSEERPQEVLDQYWQTDKDYQGYRYGRLWRFSFLPAGIFARALVRMIHYDEPTTILAMWRYGGLWRLNNQLALLEYQPEENSFRLEVRTDKVGLPQLMSQVLECVTCLVDSIYSLRADQKQTLVPCIHCWREAPARVPYLFPMEELILGMSRGSPFVYCNHITSRRVLIHHLAPDVMFGGIPLIPFAAIRFGEKIGEGGFGEVFKGQFYCLTLPWKWPSKEPVQTR